MIIQCSFNAMMFNTYILCSVIFINLCHGSGAVPMFLQLERNFTRSRIYAESLDIEYNEYDLASAAVTLICSITNEAYTNNEPPTISWIKDDKELTRPVEDISISYSLKLKAEDDGKELKCKACSKTGDQTWTISGRFIKKLTPKELLLAKPNVFKIILISLGALLGAFIILLVCYSMVRRYRKKRVGEEGGCDVSLENQTVLNSEAAVVDEKSEKEDPFPEQTYNTATLPMSDEDRSHGGIDNISWKIPEDGGYNNFAGPDSDDIVRSDSIITVSSRVESLEKQLRNCNGKKPVNGGNKSYLYLGKVETSSEC